MAAHQSRAAFPLAVWGLFLYLSSCLAAFDHTSHKLTPAVELTVINCITGQCGRCILIHVNTVCKRCDVRQMFINFTHL